MLYYTLCIKGQKLKWVLFSPKEGTSYSVRYIGWGAGTSGQWGIELVGVGL